MHSLKRLDKLLVRGAISKEEYLERIGAYETSKRVTMQTPEGIIAFLESELNEAMELHNTAKENKDMERSLTLLIKAHTIGELLEKIKFIAAMNKRSANKEIEFVLEQYVENFEKLNGEIETE